MHEHVNMKFNKDTQHPLLLADDPGPSLDPPPPFTDIDQNAHPLLDLPPQPSYEPPPPEFTPYDAEFFIATNGNVVSHDPHLNTDGEALYRFLLHQSLQAPYYRLHCRGTHTEIRSRYVTRQHNDGRTSSPQRETYTEEVTDFDFYIDINPSPPTSSPPGNHSCGPIHWSVPDSDPAYRGRMVRELEVLLSGETRKAGRGERKEYDAWCSERVALGLPPWVSGANAWQSGQVQEVNEAVILRSSKSLRQWADEYCASPKHLKEFTYEKVLYGWNIRRLRDAIRTVIVSTPYNGKIDISFETMNSKIYVRPDNRISRMLSNKWLKFLSIILLIFPFIWLFKRFHSRGGGRWEVCGGAYSLKREIRDEGPETIGEGRKIIGVREGEWFRKWESVIRRSVIGHYVSTMPIPDEEATDLTGFLDGY